MKKLFGILLVLLLLSGCSSTTTQKEKLEPYKIGGVYPLTGSLSWVGEYYKKGAELEVDLINKAGGINGHLLELVVYDDQSSPEEAVRATQRLISKDKVVAITGTGSAPISGAVSTLANQNKIPAILTSGYVIDPSKEPYTFNTANPTDYAVGSGFQYFSQNGINNVALLMPNGSLGQIGETSAKKMATQYGINIVGIEKFDVSAPDITSQLAKLRSLKPQAIFSFVTGEPAAMIAKNMQQMNMNIPLLVSHGNATPGFLKLVSNLDLKIIVPSGKIMAVEGLPNDDPIKKGLTEFNKEHEQKYNESANFFSALLADAIGLIAQGLKVSNSSDPVKLRDAIENTKKHLGINGIYNMSQTDHYGTSVSDMINMTIVKGKWQLLK